MRNTLYKAYLDDFSSFVHGVGGTTGAVMGEMLSFEVRRRASLSSPGHQCTALHCVVLLHCMKGFLWLVCGV